MDKTPAMRTVEAQTGRDIRHTISEAVALSGSVRGAANALGLTEQGLRKWIERLEGRVTTSSRAEVEFPQVAA